MLEPIPKSIWIVTEETIEVAETDGARSSRDIGAYLGEEQLEVKTQATVTRRQGVEVDKLKEEMRSFLAAMGEIFQEAEQQPSKLRLEEVELSVEINGEGKISLLGMGGAKIGSKSAMTLKFKRSNG